MLGTTMERPTSPDGQHMAPIMAYGLASNSIGYLVTDDNAMVWRGPMASKHSRKCSKIRCGLTWIIWLSICRREQGDIQLTYLKTSQ